MGGRKGRREGLRGRLAWIMRGGGEEKLWCVSGGGRGNRE